MAELPRRRPDHRRRHHAHGRRHQRSIACRKLWKARGIAKVIWPNEWLLVLLAAMWLSVGRRARELYDLPPLLGFFRDALSIFGRREGEHRASKVGEARLHLGGACGRSRPWGIGNRANGSAHAPTRLQEEPRAPRAPCYVPLEVAQATSAACTCSALLFITLFALLSRSAQPPTKHRSTKIDFHFLDNFARTALFHSVKRQTKGSVDG